MLGFSEYTYTENLLNQAVWPNLTLIADTSSYALIKISRYLGLEVLITLQGSVEMLV